MVLSVHRLCTACAHFVRLNNAYNWVIFGEDQLSNQTILGGYYSNPKTPTPYKALLNNT